MTQRTSAAAKRFLTVTLAAAIAAAPVATAAAATAAVALAAPSAAFALEAVVTWEEQDSGVAEALTGVDFADPMNGWAVGDDGTIVATVDGGATWTSQTSGTDADLAAVSFVDVRHGWAAGAAGVVLATTDGGATWALQRSEAGGALAGISFVSPAIGWAADASGAVLATTDGGATWTPRQPPDGAAVTLSAIEFGDTLNGCAVGSSDGSGGVVLGTTDGGATWTRAATSAEPLLGVAITAGAVCAVGDGGGVLTSDGASWSPAVVPGGPTLNDVALVGGGQVLAVGVRAGRGVIVAAAGGGGSWSEVSTTTYTLNAVAAAGARAWAVGDGGTILGYDPADGASPSPVASPVAPATTPPSPSPTAATSPGSDSTDWLLVVVASVVTMAVVGFVATRLLRRDD